MTIDETTVYSVITAVQFAFLFYVIIDLLRILFKGKF